VPSARSETGFVEIAVTRSRVGWLLAAVGRVPDPVGRVLDEIAKVGAGPMLRLEIAPR
jgi:hypothetical protein